MCIEFTYSSRVTCVPQSYIESLTNTHHFLLKMFNLPHQPQRPIENYPENSLYLVMKKHYNHWKYLLFEKKYFSSFSCMPQHWKQNQVSKIT